MDHLALQYLLIVAMLLVVFMLELLLSTLIQLLLLHLALEPCPIRWSLRVIHLLPLQQSLHPCGSLNHYLPELLWLLDMQDMYQQRLLTMEGTEGPGALTTVFIH